MFMSYAALESTIPAALLPPGAKIWQVLELSLRLPWFLATVEDLSEGVFRDFLLSSSVELADLIRDDATAIKCLEVMVPVHSTQRWQMHKIKRILKKANATGFTQWIFEHENGARSFCPPCSEDEESIHLQADHVLDLK